jgi:alpha-L-rhamnosidase
MNSYNHAAPGAVADWLHRTVAGLAPAGPGYRRLLVRPRPGGGLTGAAARLLTPYGPAEAGWRLEGGEITVRAVVPPNASATVDLPGAGRAPLDVGSGAHVWTYPYAPPARPPRPRTLDAALGDLRADPAAWALVRAVLGAHAPELLGPLERAAPRLAPLPARQVLATLPGSGALAAAFEAALAALGP